MLIISNLHLKNISNITTYISVLLFIFSVANISLDHVRKGYLLDKIFFIYVYI